MDVPKPMHRLESGLVQHVPQRFLIHGNHPTAEARSLSRICSLEISRRFPRYVYYAPAAIGSRFKMVSRTQTRFIGVSWRPDGGAFRAPNPIARLTNQVTLAPSYVWAS
jgi:hypothetical protein